MTSQQRWTDTIGAKLAVGTSFAGFTAAWLVLPGRAGWDHWVPAIGWAGVAALWFIRAAKQSRRSRTPSAPLPLEDVIHRYTA